MADIAIPLQDLLKSLFRMAHDVDNVVFTTLGTLFAVSNQATTIFSVILMMES
jgi:hypothetical protein